MYVLHRSCAFTDRRGHPLHRSKTNVADSEHSRHMVSKLIGCRRKGHLSELTSCPVTMKSFEVRCTVKSNQSVFGVAPISTKTTVAGMRSTGRSSWLGNSAGQAAIHLARFAEQVILVVRANSLEKGMSDYLIQQIRSTKNIEVRLEA